MPKLTKLDELLRPGHRELTADGVTRYANTIHAKAISTVNRFGATLEVVGIFVARTVFIDKGLA